MRASRARVRWGREPLGVALLLAIFVAGCGKRSGGPDAGVARQIVSDTALKFRLEVPPSWAMSTAEGRGGQQFLKLAEARRRPEPGRKFVVSPKLVVTAEPARTMDPEALARSTMDDLRGLERDGSVHIQRTAVSTRQIDGIRVGDLELAYDVRDVARDTSRKVVHRSLVVPRAYGDGRVAALTFTVTYMAEDTDLVLPEVHRMFASLEFPERIEEPPHP